MPPGGGMPASAAQLLAAGMSPSRQVLKAPLQEAWLCGLASLLIKWTGPHCQRACSAEKWICCISQWCT